MRSAARRAKEGARRRLIRPRPGAVSFGDLDRTTPIDPDFGSGRGQPIDRHFIEGFLSLYGPHGSGEISGRLLEVKDSTYSRKFGSSIVSIDVVDVDRSNTAATVHADLSTEAPELAGDAFDCIVCTQTLLLLYDLPAVMRLFSRVLARRGTLLVTVPGISQVCRPPASEVWSDYWRFTPAALDHLFREAFSEAEIEVRSYGNVKLAAAFLYGLAVEDVPAEDLRYSDSDYPLIVAGSVRRTDQAERAGPSSSLAG